MITSVNYDKPYFGYISTGSLTRMYTLRIVYEANEVVDGVLSITTSAEYIRNLSTDYDKAIEKAKGILAMMGVKFSDNGEFSLDEIRRRKADELKALNDAREYEEKILDIERYKLFASEVEEYISNGVVVGGKYNGLTVDEIADRDVGYIRWFLSAFKEAKSSAHFANWKMFNKWADDNLYDSEWLGNIGDVIELELTYVRGVSFNSPFGYNAVGWMHFLEDSKGNLVKMTSTAKFIMDLEDGEKVKLSATVKKHDVDWVDAKVTLVSRPKKVK